MADNPPNAATEGEDKKPKLTKKQLRKLERERKAQEQAEAKAREEAGAFMRNIIVPHSLIRSICIYWQKTRNCTALPP